MHLFTTLSNATWIVIVRLGPLVAVLSLLFEEVYLLFQLLNHVILFHDLQLEIADLVFIIDLSVKSVG